MKPAFWIFTLSALGCAWACTGSQPHPAVVPAASSAAPTASASSQAPTTASLCDKLAAEQKEILDRAGVVKRDEENSPWKSFGRCFPTPKGAWAVMLEAVDADGEKGTDDETWVGRWAVVHLGLDGQRVVVHPAAPDWDKPKEQADEQEQNFFWGPMEQFAFEQKALPMVFDFDKDGEPELFVSYWVWFHEGGSYSQGRLWTFRDGKVSVYGPSSGFYPERISDEDGDGRPDLWTHGPYRAKLESLASSFDYGVTGPDLLAHSLADGSFSLTDAVAQKVAKQSCPSKPQAVIVSNGEQADPKYTYERNVACARIWGVPEAKLIREIDQRCKLLDHKDGPQEDTCQSPEQLRIWARQAPPVQLTE